MRIGTYTEITIDSLKQRVEQLKRLDKLSYEESVEAYQLSLALCDHTGALHFKNIYYDLLFDLFLEITENITNLEYAKLFIKYQKEWEEAFCCYYKEIYTAIIVVQKENILGYNIIEEILLRNHGSMDSLEEKGLLQYSVKELKKMLIDEIEDHKEHQIRNDLYDIASSTNEINIVQKILQEMPPERPRYRLEGNLVLDKSVNPDPVYANLCLLQANFDIDLALRTLNLIKYTHYLEETKYELAKKIYSGYKEVAKELIESIDQKYHFDFAAYVDLRMHDEEKIAAQIATLDAKLQEKNISKNDYDESLLGIAFLIVDENPYLAYNLMEKLHKNWGTVLDVQIEVAVALFKQGDKDAGFEYFKKIEVDCLKPYALAEISSFMGDKEVLQTMLDHILEFADSQVSCYESLYRLHNKLDIPFVVFYETASKIMPHELYNYDPDAMLKMYEGYLVL